MIDAARRLSSVKILEEAFIRVKRRDEIYQRQALLVGKMLCLIFFSFRYQPESNNSNEQVNEIA